MAKIKLTKTELKRQRDALKQFRRYLPTLQLKKQQLQAEVQQIRDAVAANRREQDTFFAGVAQWSRLLHRDEFSALSELIQPGERVIETRNIAGVDVPGLVKVTFQQEPLDLFATPYWFDAALDALRTLVELQVKQEILFEQLKRLEDELRTTSQRVNLFEKVKIPECRENIRVIQIYLGDQQTAAVGRSKIAKRKAVAQAELQEVAS
jgi:V/A-type H+-transporting ATPase subunit D